ncbi:hypothetical protein [Nocardia sp. XZ_19_385]|uniref:hypothetical protein n=1 Tax=Nocardia sp. XZ_19_385 TaxID=2769488 RepID=UPI00188FC991|nr:hypothetical protein [Nocardia sp. XZ_19_385]
MHIRPLDSDTRRTRASIPRRLATVATLSLGSLALGIPAPAIALPETPAAVDHVPAATVLADHASVAVVPVDHASVAVVPVDHASVAVVPVNHSSTAAALVDHASAAIVDHASVAGAPVDHVPAAVAPADHASAAAGFVDPAPTAEAPTDHAYTAAAPGAGQSALAALQALGVTPFLYPTAALCTGAGATLTSPAVAGAVPGPWPVHSIAIPGLDLTAVKSGQTMFTFVPSGPSRSDSSGMRVAWLNVDNGRGGVAAMGPLNEVFGRMVPPEVPAALRPLAEQAVRDFFRTAIPVGGIRAVPVDTGRGTVLAAVFGTMVNGTETCFYLPTVGITTVP